MPKQVVGWFSTVDGKYSFTYIVFFTLPAPSRLVQHIRYRHVETRPHECPLCHKTYKTTHTLVDHLETHTEKCYTCSEPNCFYVATTARNFNHHMRSVHGGELLLYCCHVCNERFSLGRKLTKHLKDQHGFELPPGHSRFRYSFMYYTYYPVRMCKG